MHLHFLLTASDFDSVILAVIAFSFSSADRSPNITQKRTLEGVERTLRTEELAGDVEGLTSHNDDLLTVKQLLGDSAGQTTEEVSFAVNDDLFQKIKVSDKVSRRTELTVGVSALQS
jgi:uncharacterized protein YoxC